MKEYEFKKIMLKYRQDHVLEYYGGLQEGQKESLLRQVDDMDFNLVFRLCSEYSGHDTAGKEGGLTGDIVEPAIIDIEEALSSGGAISSEGRKRFSEGRAAIMLAAGGQGTRLGYPHPKGMYPVSPVRKKSFFQLFSEKVLALSREFGISVPLVIGTNPETRREIEDFFSHNSYFGLEKAMVLFFSQGMLPSVTSEGRLVIKEDGSLLANPDGHGGLIKGIYDSGILKRSVMEGVTDISYCHIDNPLVKIYDPMFMGYHSKAGSDFSLKVVRREDPGEKVGVLVRDGGRMRIVEYIEFPEQLNDRRDDKGNLIFWGGSIGIHIIKTDFINSLNAGGFRLPYHRQEKTLKLPGGGDIPVWKFETFIFDALPYARNVVAMETLREEEFAPVKNRMGSDSAESAAAAMSTLHRKWLREAGMDINDSIDVEISPLFAFDKDTFSRRADEVSASVKRMETENGEGLYIG